MKYIVSHNFCQTLLNTFSLCVFVFLVDSPELAKTTAKTHARHSKTATRDTIFQSSLLRRYILRKKNENYLLGWSVRSENWLQTDHYRWRLREVRRRSRRPQLAQWWQWWWIMMRDDVIPTYGVFVLRCLDWLMVLELRFYFFEKSSFFHN